MKIPEKFVILDCEYTSWPGSMQREWSEDWESREVVQIAALKINYNGELEVLEKINLLSKPLKNPQISEYFSNLTGLTQALVDTSGENFASAFQKVTDFVGKENLPIYTWGYGDELAFRESCEIHGIDFDSFFNKFLDICVLFEELGIKVQGYQSGTVYQQYDIAMHSKAHNALHDVESIFHTLRYSLQMR